MVSVTQGLAIVGALAVVGGILYIGKKVQDFGQGVQAKFEDPTGLRGFFQR